MGGWNIPLAVQPAPQNPGPMDLYKQGLGIQDLINQQGLQKQAKQQNDIALQSQQIALQQQQQDQKDQQIFNKAFHDANGDWDAAIKGAATGGASGNFINQAQIHRADTVAKMATATKDQLANEAGKSDALAKSAYRVLQAAPEDQANVYAQERHSHLISGAYSPQDIPEQMPSVEDLKSTVAHNVATQALIKDANDARSAAAKLPGEQAESRGKSLTNAAQTMGGAQNQIAWTARRNMVVGNDSSLADLIPEQYSPDAANSVRQLGITPQQAAQTPVEKRELDDFMATPPKGYKDTPVDFMRYKASITPMLNFNLANQTGGAAGPGGAPATPATIAKGFGMSQEAFDQAAEKYSSTGQLPAVGRGANGIALQRALMNRAGDLHPGQSLAANSSEYKANTSSLGKLQGQFDNVSAFENTAIKNLDQVVDAGKSIPDLGARFANVPVRMISAQMIGTPEMARFRTALLTAQTEAAKVLSSANASGVLSDSARHETQEILDGNLSFPAMMASINQLKTDMGNRHQSYGDQISDIQKRLGAKASQEQSTGGFQLPAGAKTATNPQNGHKIAVVDGKWVDAQTGKPI